MVAIARRDNVECFTDDFGDVQCYRNSFWFTTVRLAREPLQMAVTMLTESVGRVHRQMGHFRSHFPRLLGLGWWLHTCKEAAKEGFAATQIP